MEYTIRQQAEVPAQGVKQMAQTTERQRYTGNSVYQKARQAERDNLEKSLKDAGLPEVDAKNISQQTPNAKFTWVNVMIKSAVSNKSVNPCDEQLFKNMWMQPKVVESYDRMKTALGIETNVNTPITQNFPTKFGAKPVCELGQIKFNIKNPGALNMATGLYEEYPDMDTFHQEIKRYNAYKHDNPKSTCCSGCSEGTQCESEYHPAPTTKVLAKREAMHDTYDINDLRSLFSNYIRKQRPDKNYLADLGDNEYIKLLGELYEVLDNDDWDLSKIDLLAKRLSKNMEVQNYNYALNVLNPWSSIHRGDAKIPTAMPFPTASVCVRSSRLITTNASGNAAIAWNPYFATTGATASLFTVNNAATLTGSVSDNNFLPIATELICPITGAYAQYRLVSAGLRARFVGSDLNNNGRIIVGLDPQTQATGAGTVGTAVANFAKYGDFNQILNSYFCQIESCRKDSSAETIYITPDPLAYAFQYLGAPYSSQCLVACIQGGPASQACLEVDFIANFELMVENESSDWIPKTMFRGTYSSREKAIELVTAGIQNQKTIQDIRNEATKGLSSEQIQWFADLPTRIAKVPTGTHLRKQEQSFLDKVGQGLLDAAKILGPQFIMHLLPGSVGTAAEMVGKLF